MKKRRIEGKNKESRCHRASRNVFFNKKTYPSFEMVQTCGYSFHFITSQIIPTKIPSLQHLSSFLPLTTRNIFPHPLICLLCCCRVQTDTSASMMISKVVVPVTLILVTSLHTFTLPAVLDYSEPRSSRQACSFPPRIILRLCWRMTINDPHGDLENRPQHPTITLISALIYSFSR